MNTERIVRTLPKVRMQPNPAEKWQIVHDARGYFAVEWIDVNAMSAAERAECESAPEPDAEQAKYERAQIPRFPSEIGAIEWALLQDEEECVDEELSAFNAPSECYADVHRSIERRRKALLKKATEQENQS